MPNILMLSLCFAVFWVCIQGVDSFGTDSSNAQRIEEDDSDLAILVKSMVTKIGSLTTEMQNMKKKVGDQSVLINEMEKVIKKQRSEIASLKRSWLSKGSAMKTCACKADKGDFGGDDEDADKGSAAGRQMKTDMARTKPPVEQTMVPSSLARRFLLQGISNVAIIEGIGFNVRLKTELSRLIHGHKIKFDEVLENTGGAFNNQTGVFVCPQTGLYLFSFTIAITTGNTELSVGLMLDGQPKAHAIMDNPHSTGIEVQSSDTAVIAAHAGQSVWLEVDFVYHTPKIMPKYSSFTGVFIST